MTELITREEIGVVARGILDFLERKKIKYANDLERKVEGVSMIADRPGHSITLEERPSESGTLAYTISYIIDRKGIPIEARLNAARNYTRIIVKGNFELEGYFHFLKDSYGNLIQDKKLDGCSIQRLKQELKVLVGK